MTSRQTGFKLGGMSNELQELRDAAVLAEAELVMLRNEVATQKAWINYLETRHGHG